MKFSFLFLIPVIVFGLHIGHGASCPISSEYTRGRIVQVDTLELDDSIDGYSQYVEEPGVTPRLYAVEIYNIQYDSSGYGHGGFGEISYNSSGRITKISRINEPSTCSGSGESYYVEENDELVWGGISSYTVNHDCTATGISQLFDESGSEPPVTIHYGDVSGFGLNLSGGNYNEVISPTKKTITYSSSFSNEHDGESSHQIVVYELSSPIDIRDELSSKLSGISGNSPEWQAAQAVGASAWVSVSGDGSSYEGRAARFFARFDCLSEDASVELVYHVRRLDESDPTNFSVLVETKSVQSMNRKEVENNEIEISGIIIPKEGYAKSLVEVRVPDGCSGGSGGLNSSGAGLGVGSGTGSEGLDWWLNLGNAEDGRSIGNLRIRSDSIDPVNASPSLVYYDGLIDPAVTLIYGDSEVLRQVLVPQAFIDVVAINETHFELRVYPRGNESLVTVEEVLEVDEGEDLRIVTVSNLYATEDAPLAVWQIKNMGASGAQRRLEIVQVEGEDDTHYGFTYDAATEAWGLAKEGGAWREVRSHATLANGDRQTILTVLDANDVVVRKTEEVERYYPFGWRRVRVVNDPDGEAQTQAYSYYDTNSGAAFYGMLKEESDSSGGWFRYEYDTLGRRVKTVSGWKDAPVGAPESQSVVTTTSFSTDGLTATTIETTLGIETARSYFVRSADGLQTTRIRCTEQGAAINATSNRSTVTTYVANGEYKGRVASVVDSDGHNTRYEYLTNSEGQRIVTTWSGTVNSLGNFVSGTQTIAIAEPFGWELSREIIDIESGLMVDGYIVTSMDDKGRALRIDYFDGTYEEKSYACCGITTHRDRQGVLSSYTYDALGHRESETRNGITIITRHDAVGRLLSVEREGTDDSIHLLQQNTYNLAGELTATIDGAGEQTAYIQSLNSAGGLVMTTVFPDGGTSVEEHYLDGRVKSVSGTGVRPIRYEYELLAGGLTATKEIRIGTAQSEDEWVRSVYDFSGRLIRTEYPDSAQSFVYYNAKGQRIREVDADGVTRLYWQSDDGSQTESAIDLNDNGMIDAGDRRSKQLTSYVSVTGVGVVSRTEQWVDSGSGYELDSVSETSVDGLWSRTVSHGLVHSSQTVYDGTGGWTTTSIAPDGAETVSTSANGLPVSTVSAVGSTTYAHDAHGRLVSQTDVATGIVTTTAYGAGDRVSSVTRAGEVTEYEYYDWRGMPLKITHPGGTTSEYSYSLTGDLLSVGGTSEYPISYTYDPQGRRTGMTTSSGTTLWNYDSERGWLNQKVHADAGTVSYTYTATGRLASRQWARGLVTTYSYDAAGDLNSQDYSDSTVGYTYVRDVRGRIVAVEDGFGNREFIFDAQGRLLSEAMSTGPLAGIATEYSYDALHRRSGLTLKAGANPIHSIAYGYDTASRLASVSSQGVQADYSRLAGGNRLVHKSVSLNANLVMAVAYSYDGKGRLSSIASTPQIGDVHSMGYQYDAHGRRSQAQRADASYWNYGYNARGEVTSGKRYWQGGDPVSGMDFGYSFDDIGNRLSVTVNGRQSAYAANNVNQYTSRTVPAWFDLFGIVATLGSEVEVNQNALLIIEHGFFHATVPAANGAQPAFVPITVSADDGSGHVPVEGNRFVPQSPEAFRYDADGNLLEDGRWLYTWDGENRLIAMQTRPEVIAAGAPGRRLIFGYDYMGRRVSKEAYAWHRNAWQPLHQRTFVYDGWNLVAERRADGSLIRTYTWGEDVSGNMQGAGGVGGLLAIHDHIENKTFVPAYDGNGNVIALIDAATGTTAATYEYDPFGNLLLQNGAYALINPFRFSTKYTDNESGLLYYGYRYYNPETGRWLSRDPIEEQGGVNMYAFARNDGVNRIDPLGLREVPCEVRLFYGHFTEAANWAEAAARELKRLKETYTLDGVVDNSRCIWYGTGSCASPVANFYIPKKNRLNNRTSGYGNVYCNDLKEMLKVDIRDALNKLKETCDKCNCKSKETRIEISCSNSVGEDASAKQCLGPSVCGDSGKKDFRFSCKDLRKDGFIQRSLSNFNNHVDSHVYGS